MADGTPTLVSLAEPKQAATFYRRVLDRYSARDRFGMISKETGQPAHRNHRRNPLPVYANRARRPDSNGPKKTLKHLLATKENRQAVFLVNRPDAETYLLAVDWDCTAAAVDGERRVQELAESFDADIARRSFIEPSRNRRGRYNWIKVRRQEPLLAFLSKLNDLNRLLSQRYGRKDDHDGIGFDAIKGSPWHYQPNPLYCPTGQTWARIVLLDARNASRRPTFLDSQCERYEWHRTHYKRGQFDRIEALEPAILRFGTLVTQPLCGVLNDGDAGAARWRDFFEWESDDKQTITSTELWSLFGLHESSHLPTAPNAPTAASPSQSTAASDRPGTNSARRGRLWAMLQDKENKLDSMNGAAAITVTRLGAKTSVDDPSAALSACLNLYEQFGAATGVGTADRVRRAAEALQYFASTHDEAKRSRVRFGIDQDLKKDVGGLINCLMSNEQLAKFNSAHWAVDAFGYPWHKGRTYVTRRLLHVAYCCCIVIIVHDAGALSMESLNGFLRHFGHTCNGATLRTLMMIFAHLGLFTCVDANYRFFPRNGENEYQQIPGKCRIWAIAHDAPLPRFVLPHVPHRTSHNGRGRYTSPQAAEDRTQRRDDQASTCEPPAAAPSPPENEVFVSAGSFGDGFCSHNGRNGSQTDEKLPVSGQFARFRLQTSGGYCAPAVP